MNAKQRETLVAAASEALQHAYAGYSKFPVGAALLAESGEIYRGANVENASLGLTLCAERVAMATGIVAGARSFSALAVVSRGSAAPCGACRQFLAEFCDDLPIVLADLHGRVVTETALEALMPAASRFRKDWSATDPDP